MVIALLTAWAGPVVCDPNRAKLLLDETGILPARVPVIAPTLLPGLARDVLEGEDRAKLDTLCATPERVSLASGERWESGTYAAYTFRLSTSQTVDCALEQTSVALTVGVKRTGDLSIALLHALPPTITPIGDCPISARYREERVLAGEDEGVRLVLQIDRNGEAHTSRVLVREASAQGWRETVLLEPAPAHLVGGKGGPQVSLTGCNGAPGSCGTRGRSPWIVIHHEVTEDCQEVRGQIVWRRTETGWEASTGREALGLLADRGLWRLAGEDGWFLVVAQDDPKDRALLEARQRKRQSLQDDDLKIRESGRFPMMNAGFLFVSPDPWTREEDAEEARRAWWRRTGVYVRQGWEATFACEPPKQR